MESAGPNINCEMQTGEAGPGSPPLYTPLLFPLFRLTKSKVLKLFFLCCSVVCYTITITIKLAWHTSGGANAQGEIDVEEEASAALLFAARTRVPPTKYQKKESSTLLRPVAPEYSLGIASKNLVGIIVSDLSSFFLSHHIISYQEQEKKRNAGEPTREHFSIAINHQIHHISIIAKNAHALLWKKWHDLLDPGRG